MGNYSKDNYETLKILIKEHFGFTIDNLHSSLCEFIYGNEYPLFRLIYVDEMKTIGISFHVSLPKSDAFTIMDFIRSQLPKVTLSEEYLIDDNDQVLIGQDAYIEYERKIEEQVYTKNNIVEEIEYTPEIPITYTIPHAIYHAQDPKSIEAREFLKQQFRYFGKFTWDDR